MWKLLSFISKSKQRQKVLFCLKEAKTPTQIADETKLAVSHISRSLKEFTEKGLVKCVTPKEKMGRIYTLTDEGKKLMIYLKKRSF